MNPQERTVAVLGASTNRSKYGNKSVRAHQRAGWKVLPINPRADEIEGLTAYSSLADAPGPIHRISVYLPPKLSLEMLDDMANVHPEEVWFNPGAADSAVLAEAESKGLPAVDGCSIIDVGFSPSQFPS